jgi:hypothetical protein
MNRVKGENRKCERKVRSRDNCKRAKNNGRKGKNNCKSACEE